MTQSNKKTAKAKTKKMTKTGSDVLEGLNEALDFLRGKPTEGNVLFMYNGEAVSIKNIRTKLGLSCEEFAKAFAFKTKTIQNWEQGLRTPPEHVLAYLRVIAEHPRRVYKALHNIQGRLNGF